MQTSNTPHSKIMESANTSAMEAVKDQVKQGIQRATDTTSEQLAKLREIIKETTESIFDKKSSFEGGSGSSSSNDLDRDGKRKNNTDKEKTKTDEPDKAKKGVNSSEQSHKAGEPRKGPAPLETSAKPGEPQLGKTASGMQKLATSAKVIGGVGAVVDLGIVLNKLSNGEEQQRPEGLGMLSPAEWGAYAGGKLNEAGETLAKGTSLEGAGAEVIGGAIAKMAAFVGHEDSKRALEANGEKVVTFADYNPFNGSGVFAEKTSVLESRIHEQSLSAIEKAVSEAGTRQGLSEMGLSRENQEALRGLIASAEKGSVLTVDKSGELHAYSKDETHKIPQGEERIDMDSLRREAGITRESKSDQIKLAESEKSRESESVGMSMDM